VPVPHKDALFVKAGKVRTGRAGHPLSRHFPEDEAPALSGWTKEKFGGFKHQFYVKVFELILRRPRRDRAEVCDRPGWSEA
jgi:hypothetical protein